MDYVLAKLHKPKTGNDWYIYYSCVDENGKMVMFKDRSGLNRIKDLKDRERHGNILVVKINQKLEAGWNRNFVDVEEEKRKSQAALNKQNFHWWFEERIKYSKAKHSESNYATLKTVHDKLKEFAPVLAVKEVTYKFLTDFEAYLINLTDRSGKKKLLTKNTISSYLVRVKIIINQIVRSGDLLYHQNPFLQYEFEWERIERNRAPYEEILKLWELDLTPNPNVHPYFLKTQIHRELTRDMYIFSFYLGGIRFGDLCRLQHDWFTDTHLNYTMHKTDIKRRIKLKGGAHAILNKYKDNGSIYLFPTGFDAENEDKSIKLINSCCNRRLKSICKDLGINELTFHTSRHSFADYAKKKRMDIHTIKELLGHKEVATTEYYMRHFYEEETDGAMDRMFD